MNYEDAFAKLTEKLDGWLDQAVLLLPNFLVGLVVVVVFWLVAKLVKKGVGRLLDSTLDFGVVGGEKLSAELRRLPPFAGAASDV